MKYLLFVVFFFNGLSAQVFLDSTTLHEHKISKNSNILSFLDKYNIPKYVYYDLSSENKEILSDIIEGSQVYILSDEHNNTIQALMQINEMMQLRIYKGKDNKYLTDLMPISYSTQTKVLHTKVTHSPYKAIVDIDPSLSDLAEEFKAVFFNTIDFRKDIRKGDAISIVYEEKSRLSKRLVPPRIKSAMMSVKGVDYYVYYYKDRYYSQKGHLLNKLQLFPPLKKARVTSKFSLKRFHPILKRYRAHHGIDYGARKNTKIRSALNGKVVFKGVKGGYGKTVIIEHANGYKTLYAHMNKFSSRIYKNKYIKEGTYIGNVGNTGMSTGNHLHFGLYKHGRPINPKSFIDNGQFNLKGKKLQKFYAYLSRYKDKMTNASYGISSVIRIASSSIKNTTKTAN